MSKQLTFQAVQCVTAHMPTDHAGLTMQRAEEFMLEAMNTAAELIAEEFDVKVVGPADCWSEEALIGFSCDNVTPEIAAAFDGLDSDGEWT